MQNCYSHDFCNVSLRNLLAWQQYDKYNLIVYYWQATLLHVFCNYSFVSFSKSFFPFELLTQFLHLRSPLRRKVNANVTWCKPVGTRGGRRGKATEVLKWHQERINLQRFLRGHPLGQLDDTKLRPSINVSISLILSW